MFSCSHSIIFSGFDRPRESVFNHKSVSVCYIYACHVGFDNKTVGEHPLVYRFIKGARRALPVSKPLSAWDLGLVLDSLSMSPFEALD